MKTIFLQGIEFFRKSFMPLSEKGRGKKIPNKWENNFDISNDIMTNCFTI